MKTIDATIDDNLIVKIKDSQIPTDGYDFPLDWPIRVIDSIESLEQAPIVAGDVVSFETSNNTFLYTVTTSGLKAKDSCSPIIDELNLNRERLSGATYQHALITTLSNDFPETTKSYVGVHKIVYTLLMLCRAQREGVPFKEVVIGEQVMGTLLNYKTKFKKGDKLRVLEEFPDDMFFPYRTDLDSFKGNYIEANVQKRMGGDYCVFHSGREIPDAFLVEVSEKEWKNREKEEFKTFVKGFLPTAIKRNKNEAEVMLRNKLQSCFHIMRKARLEYWASVEKVTKSEFDSIALELMEEMEVVKQHPLVDSINFTDGVFKIDTKNIIIDDISFDEDVIIENRDETLESSEVDVFDMGTWTIVVDLVNGRSRAHRIGQSATNGRHPHINGSTWNNYCLGSLSSQYSAAISDFRIHGIFNCVISLLRSYNHKSPYSNLWEIKSLNNDNLGHYEE